MSSPSLGKENRRVILATMIGTTIEWYDFFIYALSAGLVFGSGYFSKLGGTIVSFATVGISFLFRPLGAVIAGHLGDKIGRKTMLILTLLLMGISTALIGLVPSATAIGAAAPLLIIILRIIQGLSAGGEWGGAAMLAVEHAPSGKRGLFGAFPQIGVPIGMLLANGVYAGMSALTTHSQFLSWGWRIPFLLSIVLIVVGTLIRSRVAESPVFEEVREEQSRASVPLVTLFRYSWGIVILAALLFAANNALGYMTTGGYVQHYAVDILDVAQTPVLLGVMAASLAWLITTLLGGWLADKWGRLTVFKVGFIIQLIWIFPAFALITTTNIGLIFLALILYAVGLGFTYGPQPALYAEIFPTSVRYSGAAIAYAIGAVLGGAFAPTIAEALETSTGSVYAVATYLGVMTVIGLIAAFFITERKDISLRGDESERPLSEHN